MKTAISIPDDIFAQAEEFAKSRKMSRSALFTEAVYDYIQKHRRDDITRKLNDIYSKESSSLDPVISKIQSLSTIQEESW